METQGAGEVPLIRLPFPTMEGRLLSHEVGGGSTPSVWAPSPVGWGPLPLGATSRYARKKPRFLSGCPAWNPGGAEFASSWISGAGITQHPLELPESLGKGRRSSLLFSVLHMVTLCPLNTNTPPRPPPLYSCLRVRCSRSLTCMESYRICPL